MLTSREQQIIDNEKYCTVLFTIWHYGSHTTVGTIWQLRHVILATFISTLCSSYILVLSKILSVKCSVTSPDYKSRNIINRLLQACAHIRAVMRWHIYCLEWNTWKGTPSFSASPCLFTARRKKRAKMAPSLSVSTTLTHTFWHCRASTPDHAYVCACWAGSVCGDWWVSICMERKQLSELLLPSAKVLRLKMSFFMCIQQMCDTYFYVGTLGCAVHDNCACVEHRKPHLKPLEAYVSCSDVWVCVCFLSFMLQGVNACGCAEGSRSQADDWHVHFGSSIIVSASGLFPQRNNCHIWLPDMFSYSCVSHITFFIIKGQLAYFHVLFHAVRE